MSATTAYETALDAARSGARVVGEHLPLDRLPLDRLPLDRLPEVDWSDTPLSDLSLGDFDLDDVIDDVTRAVRRYPVATLAIVAMSVAATCGVLWFVFRRRKRDGDEHADLSLAGAA